VFGFVVQNGNRIQIRSEFSSNGDYPANVQASVDYANQVLRAGYGVQAFTGALNVLTAADGTINQTAFAQLTPEAYGSSMELGTDTALNVIDATRGVRLTTPIEDGFYGFGQGLAGNHKIGGQADTGAASARFDAGGYFGGIGYGMGGGKLQVGAFLGKTSGDQKLSKLDARTDVDGILVGAYADASLGGLGLHGLLAYSSGNAKTVRNMLVGETAKGDYRLKTWFADASIDYRMDLGGMTVAPRAGVSYVGVERTAVAEDGAGDFSLLVGSDRRSSWFADASISVSGRFALGGIGVAPYAEVGLRHLLNDGGHKVSGRFAGAPGDPITVSGVERDATQGRFGTGIALDLSKKVRLDAGYSGEFKDFERSTVTARATIRF
jgi:fibronectin-binding autotransporter adhesin